ncbi:protein FAR-RED IMPAIRED RESPONSE 1-like [Silene latifolia]|uniref:protein FAR-RED IMPAIRED RESPONSE 1-like n=1 Tax=Silene latifolia TaxID=37657 RepID=UPI003D7847D8
MDSDSKQNTMRAVFSSLEAGIKFYGVSRACGFTPRKYTAKKLRGGIAHQKFIVFNRQEFRGNKQKLRSIPVDEHNNGDSSSTVETVERLNNSKFNIGVAKTFRQVKELVHGYENIGATLVDFKNFQRDIKCYIGERDGDLFLDRLEKLKTTQPQFYFAYDVDASNCLTKVIWVDSTSIINYSFFGDAVSFDPTYGTNKYDKDSDLEPFEFEEKWQQLISDFQLEDRDWLSTMFTDRKHWIPAYHRDLPMGYILRTTQRSESANSFFERYENHLGTLVEFWMSDHSLPNLDTNIHFKKHGAIVYTHAVFKMFQEEVKAAISCGIADFDKEDNLRIIFVEDAESNKTFKVTFNLSTTDAEYACKLFEKMGLLCRHIVWVYKGKGIRQIPSKYILDRWAKNSHLTNRLDPNGNVIEDSNMAQSDNILVCKLWAEFSATVGVLKTLAPAHMDELASLLVDFREKLSVTPLTKDQKIEMLLGCNSSSEVTIRPPVKAHNKGSGKRFNVSKNTSHLKGSKAKETMCILQGKS